MTERTSSNQRQVIHTDKAPAAIGPYSQAIRAGGLLYCSGQIAINPDSGELCDGSVSEQTDQVLRNLGAVLDAGSSSYKQVVRCTIFVTDMGDFAAVNEVYARYFPSNPPSRACVEVSGLPKGVSVEIDAIALTEP